MAISRHKNRRLRTAKEASELVRQYLARLADKVGCPEQVRLVELWRNWPVVMGEEIAELGLPIGHKDRRLDVGTDDSMALQELTYLRDEIIGRANAFMEEEFFNDVRVTLVLNKKPLSPGFATPVVAEPAPVPEVPRHATGRWLHLMDPNSPIARCYRAYCGLPEEGEGMGTGTRSDDGGTQENGGW